MFFTSSNAPVSGIDNAIVVRFKWKCVARQATEGQKMLKYVLQEKTKDKLIYLYYPEGKGEPGRVVFSVLGEVIDITNAPNDYSGVYKVHARGIDITKEKGMIAWY